MKKIILLLLGILFNTFSVQAQSTHTNEDGRIETYNRDRTSYIVERVNENLKNTTDFPLIDPEPNFLLGYLTTTTKYPNRFNLDKNPVQSGFMFGTKYKIHNLEDISTAGVGNFTIGINGSFRLGFAGNSSILSYYDAGADYKYSVKHYTVLGDLFSLSANAEYKTGIIAGRGMEFGLSVTFFNIGGTVTYMEGGRYEDDVIGIVNFLPLYIEPYAKLKFKGGIIGIGLLLNPYSFVEYRFGPVDFFDGNEDGIQINSTKISKYAIELYFRF